MMSEERPVIDATERDLERLTKLSLEALIAANDPPLVFRCSNRLARIQQDDDNNTVIRIMDGDALRHRLTEVATWIKRKDYGERRTPPPMEVVRDLMTIPNINLPIITRVVEAPIFASDGTLQQESGYHRGTRTYYEPAPGFTIPVVPATPSSDDIRKARNLIKEDLLKDFPFTSETDAAHAIAFLVLPFVREMIDGPTPLYLVDKPSPGTGASLLTEILTYVFSGRYAPAMTEAHDEDEWRKRITSKLAKMPTFFFIDNVSRPLNSSHLAAAIVATTFEDRILGRTEMIRFPVRCAWIATGNNPSVSLEMARRIIRIRLDAHLDRPWLRDSKRFKHPDLRGWIADHRADLVWAVLTLVQGWIAAGKPPVTDPVLGNFEKWSSVIGGILKFSEVQGFLANIDAFYDECDSDRLLILDLIEEWWKEHKDTAVGVSKLYDTAKKLESPLDLGGDFNERSQKTALGKFLVKLRDRQFNLEDRHLTLRVERAGEKKRAQLWKLKEVPAEEL